MPDLPLFSYTRPGDLRAAVAAIGRPGACIYAGGTDLLVGLSDRRPWLHFVRELVDIKYLPEAHGVQDRGARLRVGALVTAAELAVQPLVRRHARVLAEAAALTSAPALRRRATLGGNVCTPHPAGDITTALLALDATVEIADARARYEIGLSEFIREQTQSWPRQRLVLAVSVRKCRRSAFEKVGTRAAFTRSLVAVAAARFDDGRRVAVGGLHERPFLCAGAATWSAGTGDLGAILRRECRPPADGLASEAYRLRLAAVLVRRATARVEPA
jgi:carbon-monoxide dehydrogenase medium subunit